MENATKALLIAASVLIAITLIALGISLLGSSQGVVEETGSVSEATGISIFNSQYANYEGQRMGSEVKSLLQKVRANNQTNTDRIINVSYGSYTDVATIIEQINLTASYKISLGYSSITGYVNSINISLIK